MTTAVAFDIVVGLLSIPAFYRWLRVAQREHYLAGRVTAIATLWSRVRSANILVWLVALAFIVAATFRQFLVLPAAALLAFWPIGMALRPKSKKLKFTPRLTRLTVALVVVLVAVFATLGPIGGAVALLAGALVMDLLLLLLTPVEAALAGRFVRSAEAKLRSVNPTVIAITGSYGKTSTKQYAAHLLGGFRSTLATPASFNNLLGISRTINERLVPGTEVFIAEMGTYGKGEIRTLCEHFPPSIAAITTIGEAHLERMRTRSHIAAAKAEILERAATVVLNMDVPELAALADTMPADKRVIRCSTVANVPADVTVVRDGPDQTVAYLEGREIARVRLAGTAHEANVAMSIGLAYAAGVPARQISAALGTLPDVEHRAVVNRLATGVVVIDDTYNSNPTGAERAVSAAAAIRGGDGSRLWVVTPGMVELGTLQRQRNQELAETIAGDPRATLAVVGRTNRSALMQGARARHTAPLLFETRAKASDAVLTRAQPGDVVLFENDLPDHYP